MTSDTAPDECLDRRRTAVRELWQIEACRTIAVIQWLIRLGEATLHRFGDSDPDKWDLNEPLWDAIEEARRDVVVRGQQSHPFYADVHAELTIARLANAISARLGKGLQPEWSPCQLGSLAWSVLRP